MWLPHSWVPGKSDRKATDYPCGPTSLHAIAYCYVLHPGQQTTTKRTRFSLAGPVINSSSTAHRCRRLVHLFWWGRSLSARTSRLGRYWGPLGACRPFSPVHGSKQPYRPKFKSHVKSFMHESVRNNDAVQPSVMHHQRFRECDTLGRVFTKISPRNEAVHGSPADPAGRCPKPSGVIFGGNLRAFMKRYHVSSQYPMTRPLRIRSQETVVRMLFLPEGW